jgi:hypothetical protein
LANDFRATNYEPIVNFNQCCDFRDGPLEEEPLSRALNPERQLVGLRDQSVITGTSSMIHVQPPSGYGAPGCWYPPSQVCPALVSPAKSDRMNAFSDADVIVAECPAVPLKVVALAAAAAASQLMPCGGRTTS